MGVERYGSKTDVVVKLVLVFFIALLSFSIGTFVGKKFSDNQHKLAELEPGHKDSATAENSENAEGRGIASVAPDAGEVKPEKALSDDEISKLAEEFITDEKSDAPGKMNDKVGNEHTQAKNEHETTTASHEAPVKDAHAAPAAAAAVHAPANTGHGAVVAPAAPAAHGAPAVAGHEVLKPAARMAEGGSAVVENPARPASRIPSSLPKEVASSAIGKYTVQVAAYPNEKEAQTMAADLKSKGFSAFYVSAKVKGQTWYRVSVGLFTTIKEADTYKSDLITRAKVSTAIVQKITSAE
jgi:cell division protein FtsN